MAVTTTVTSANFTGTGVSSSYAPGFYINRSDQVQVRVDGVLKTLGDDYVVNGVGASVGCTIVGTFASGSLVDVERVTPITQLVDTQNNETILEDVLDDEFDKLTMIAQETAGKCDRALVVPAGETVAPLPAAGSRAGKFMKWSASGLDVVLTDGTGVQAQAFEATFTATAGQTAFVLPFTPEAGVFVYLNGIRLVGSPAPFTVAGNVLTLASPADLGDTVTALIGDPGGAAPTAEAITFTQAGGGARVRTVAERLRDEIWLTDFTPVGTDWLPAMQSALAAAAAAGGGAVRVPAGQFAFSGGFTIPDRVSVEGGGMIASAVNPGGTVFVFPASTPACVTATGGNNQTANLRNCVVTRTGTPAAGSVGVLADRGQSLLFENVFSFNHAIPWAFVHRNPNGITATMEECFSAMATEDHILMDSWPELRINGGRFGINGASDFNCNSYIRITALDPTPGPGSGPNTLVAIGAHFNQGQNAPNYFLDFDGVDVAYGNAVEFAFEGCHVEGLAVALIHSDAGTTNVARMTIGSGTVLNCPAAKLFDLNAATSIGQFEFNGAKAYCAAWTLNFNVDRGIVSFIGGEISGAATINGHATNVSKLAVQGTDFSGGLTLGGKFENLVVSTPSNVTMNATPHSSNSILDVRSFGANVLVGKTQVWRPSNPSGYLPSVIGDMGFDVISNTSVALRLKGTDGVVRSALLALS